MKLKTGGPGAREAALRRAYRRAEAALYAAPSRLSPALLAPRRGQTTIEYLLMLAVVGGMAAIMGVLFHRRILGGIFTLVGMIIGAGTPK
jgi:hypothetical protein